MYALAAQQGDMWGPMEHMGWAGGPFMWIFWLTLLALILTALWSLATLGRDSGPRATRSAESAEEILKRRFARGEIDEQTYQRMHDQITG